MLDTILGTGEILGAADLQALKDLHNSNGNNPQAQKVIDDGYHKLILAPQIKAQEEQIEKQKKAKELEYATLKMRIMELMEKVGIEREDIDDFFEEYVKHIDKVSIQ